MFSKVCEYGIKAAILLAQSSQAGEICNVKKVSKAINSPEAYTAKVLQMLVKASLIKSIKGAQGGFFLDEQKAKKITLLQIVIAIDGNSIAKECVLGLRQCSDANPCPMHPKYKQVREKIMNMLTTTSIYDLAHDLRKKTVFLKN